MKIQITTCSRCGYRLSTEFCEFCDPDVTWESDDPTDEELAEMSFYYDELELESRIDAHDDLDYDYECYNV